MTDKFDDGRSLFPTTEPIEYIEAMGSGTKAPFKYGIRGGATLWDFFAAHALAGLHAESLRWIEVDGVEGELSSTLARIAGE